MNINHNKTLTRMLNELKDVPSIYKPSNFWIDLNRIHLDQLMNSDLNDFKRSVNMRYFNWGVLGIIRHQLWPVLSALSKGNFSPVNKSSFKDYNLNLGKSVKRFNSIAAQIYRIYVASLFDFVSKFDEYKILKKINEPQVGNPFIVNYKNRLISQDLCNSVHEFSSIMKHIPESKKIDIAELGPGHGRLGHIFLKTLPQATYCFIDIPPALYIAQFYISKIFPKEKIFKFRPFSAFGEVKREFEESRIKFLMPHQIELLPKKLFDLFITISSLHEMRRDQITNYIKQIERLTKGFFYTKQWKQARTPDNQNIKENEYPIPKKWKTIVRNSPHSIQRMFFDTLYKIRQ